MTLGQGQEIFIDSISCLHQATFKSQTAIVAKISIVFTISHVKFQNCHCNKIGQGYPRVIILANYDGLAPPILHTKFHGNRPTGSGEIFVGFYHMWALRPSWSCDQDMANKISIPLSKEAPHKIST